MNSKVPEKQCIHAAKSCNCYVFMYQDAFRFFVLLKNMLFCYSLLAATNHKTYQQIERSNNFFQKKNRASLEIWALSLRRKKAPRPDAGDQFCVANRLVEAGRVQFSSEKVPRTLSKAQKIPEALPKPPCWWFWFLPDNSLFLQLVAHLLMGHVPGLVALAAKDHEVGHCIVPTVR